MEEHVVRVYARAHVREGAGSTLRREDFFIRFSLSRGLSGSPNLVEGVENANVARRFQLSCGHKASVALHAHL